MCRNSGLDRLIGGANSPSHGGLTCWQAAARRARCYQAVPQKYRTESRPYFQEILLISSPLHPPLSDSNAANSLLFPFPRPSPIHPSFTHLLGVSFLDAFLRVRLGAQSLLDRHRDNMYVWCYPAPERVASSAYNPRKDVAD